GVLNWAQIRLVAAVATPEDETEWLARAERRTVRALAAAIRTPPDSEDDDIARFRLRCPRRVRLLWHQVVEVARRMAGSDLTQGQAAEAIAAEGLSARPPCGDAWPAPEPPAATPSSGRRGRRTRSARRTGRASCPGSGRSPCFPSSPSRPPPPGSSAPAPFPCAGSPTRSSGRSPSATALRRSHRRRPGRRSRS